RVNVGGLVATTLKLRDADLTAGRLTFQQGSEPLGTILNAGTITAAAGGSVALSAPGVVNTGTIVAQGGSVHLSSGERLTVDFLGDGLIRFVVEGALAGQIRGPGGQPLSSRVDNQGRIEATGGNVTL